MFFSKTPCDHERVIFQRLRHTVRNRLIWTRLQFCLVRNRLSQEFVNNPTIIICFHVLGCLIYINESIDFDCYKAGVGQAKIISYQSHEMSSDQNPSYLLYIYGIILPSYIQGLFHRPI